MHRLIPLLAILWTVPALGQTVSSIAGRGACSTSGIEGLSAQLAEAQRCMNPGAFVRFAPHPGITLTSSRVHPYVQASSRDALHRAAARSPISVNSAFRTLADQYVLYHSGGCGLAARPGRSNHQSGRAVDVGNYSAVRSILQSEGCSWLGSSDPVHFDCPGSDKRPDTIRAFQRLWNLNNPSDTIAEDGLYGPATESRLARSPAAGFATDGCETAPPPPPTGGRLRGVVYQGEDIDVRVPSATVRLVETGATMSADATGSWQFDVPAGDYTVEASASGFVTGTHRCTVATGDTWCSVSLTPGSTEGTALGVAFEDLGDGEMDARLAGAVVMVTETGESATADSEGNWRIDLPPGTYTFVVRHPGYRTAMRSCEVSADEESWCSVGLTPEMLTGALQGAIFEGTNLARRIVGATIRVVENGMSATSREGDGIWRIELGAGDYTVEASGPGFTTETRRCTVAVSSTTWCSIGLDPEDAGGGRSLSVEEVDDVSDIGDDVPGSESPTGLRSGSSLKSGCSAGGASGAGTCLFGLLLMRRRR